VARTSTTSAADFLPAERTLVALREAARGCRGCELYKNATQTVFGVGPADARLMLVGEQPGDREDVEGLPFVGPAGGVLDRALIDAGVDRDAVYLTNAVKHFRWAPKGKRRIHQTPRASEIRACQPWLEAEIDVVRPELIAALGAVAVTSLLGEGAKVTKDRGRIVESVYGPCLVTVHPSSILRVEDGDERQAAYALFVQDLKVGVRYLQRVKAV
jgi:uracil-DNA glycosylase family protein